MSLIFPDGSRTVPLGTAMPTRSPQPSTVGAGTETELPGMDGEWVRMPDGSYQPAGQPRRRPPRQRQVPTQASRPASGNNIGPGEGGVFTPIPSAGGMPPADPTRMTPLQLERYHKAWMQDYERRQAEWKLQQMMKEAETGDQIGKPAPDEEPDLRQLIQDVRKSQATAQQSVAPDEQRPWKVENGRVVFMDTPEYERRTARRDSQRELQEDAAHERRMKSEAANRRNQKERALLAERRKNRGTFKNRPLEKEARREASARQERLRAERAKMPKPGDAQPIPPQEQGTPYGEPGGDPRVLDYYFSLVASGESLPQAEAKARRMAKALGVQFGSQQGSGGNDKSGVGQYGQYAGGPPAYRTADWRDSDGDGIDDREQPGPGRPRFPAFARRQAESAAGGGAASSRSRTSATPGFGRTTKAGRR